MKKSLRKITFYIILIGLLAHVVVVDAFVHRGRIGFHAVSPINFMIYVTSFGYARSGNIRDLMT